MTARAAGAVDLSMAAVARRSLERSIGNGWKGRGRFPVDLVHVPSRLTVIASIWELEDDGVDWIHASIAHDKRTPAYDEMKALHAAVFGDRFAFQVFAPPDRHVNIHAHALHLFGRVDGHNPLPDFGRFGSI